jgi:competence protein CoiA
MHLCALNSSNEIIFAFQAIKQTDYRCLECHAPVRLREGMFRQPHFYHKNSGVCCRQNGKSLTHPQLQLYIQSLLPKECALEVPFPSIQRVADVVWAKERLVFEIQCSPISRTEVLERTEDYRNAGYEVVWILHERQFNKRRLTPCEYGLKNIPHYYSNMTSERIGMIYDQWACVEKSMRKIKLAPLPIDITAP